MEKSHLISVSKSHDTLGFSRLMDQNQLKVSQFQELEDIKKRIQQKKAQANSALKAKKKHLSRNALEEPKHRR